MSQQAVSVTLSDMDAMMPTRILSSARQAGEALVVNARISHLGDAMPKAGDLAANPIILDKQTEVSLMISQIVP